MAQEDMEITSPPTQPNNDGLNWILFAFGSVMLVIGIDLSRPDQINPSIRIGIIVIIAALGLIGIAFYRMTASFLPANIHNSI